MSRDPIRLQRRVAGCDAFNCGSRPLTSADDAIASRAAPTRTQPTRGEARGCESVVPFEGSHATSSSENVLASPCSSDVIGQVVGRQVIPIRLPGTSCAPTASKRPFAGRIVRTQSAYPIAGGRRLTSSRQKHGISAGARLARL